MSLRIEAELRFTRPVTCSRGRGRKLLDELRAAAGKYQLTFGPDPATHSHCAIGGMLGNNSCGIHSLLSARHGHGLRTSDNTCALNIVTYDGDRMNVGQTLPEQLESLIQAGGAQGRIYARLKDWRDKYAQQLREHFPKLPRRVESSGTTSTNCCRNTTSTWRVHWSALKEHS